MRNITTKAIIIATLSMLAMSCSNSKATYNEIPLDDAIEKELLASEYIERLEYIPLQTTDESLMGNVMDIHYDDEYIIAKSRGRTYLFDRKNGNYIKQIGIRGRGPNEYSSYPYGANVDFDNNTIMALKNGNPIVYAFPSGNMVDELSNVSIKMSGIGKVAYVGNGVWVSGICNISGREHNSMIFFNNDGVVDSIANCYLYKADETSVNLNLNEIIMNRYDGKTFYKSLYCDTLYNITNRTLDPAWIFATSQSSSSLLALRSNLAKEGEQSEFVHLIRDIQENDNFLSYISTLKRETWRNIYNKKTQQLYKTKEKGMKNDLDGGLPFWSGFEPYNNTLIMAVDPSSLKEAIEANTIDSPQSKALKELMINVKDDDNPVIVIAHLKK